MAYRDEELSQLRGENATLKSDNEHLLQDRTRVEEENEKLRAKIPSNPHRLVYWLLFLTIAVLLSGLVTGAVHTIMIGLEELEAHNTATQRVNDARKQQEEAERLAALESERLQTHPQLQYVTFGERLFDAELQGYNTTGGDRNFYVFRQETDSMVEFDVHLLGVQVDTARPGMPQAILEVYRTGTTTPCYRQTIPTGRQALLLPQGEYRFRLKYRANPNRVTSSIVRVYRLQREDT